MKSDIASRIFVVLAAGAVAVAVILGIVNVARAQSITIVPNTSQAAGIVVCGQGTAEIHPDQAVINAGVTATASTAEAARSQAAQAMTAVLAAVKRQGVADDDVQTEYFSIEPEYDYSAGSPTITGYTASNEVTITIRAINNTGSIVDAVTAAGGNDVVVNGIDFSNGNPSAALEQAQQNALANAHEQAEMAASAAGVTLGAPLSVNLNGCGNGASATEVPFAAASAAGGQATNPTTPVSPGQIQVTAQVGVDYAVH